MINTCTSIDFTDEAKRGLAGPAHHKHYVILRDDLPPDLAYAEVGHAAGESASIRPPPDGCHMVVLSATRDELHRLAAKFSKLGLPIRCIYEDVDPFKDQLVAIGVAPCTPEASRWLQHLRLQGRPRK